ncbi:MAG: HAMP domain-containing histidine kinase [Nitrospira sp.]|nr:HAMP domain-containing histidine kinase [Nitrospira sp.]MDH4368869.1 HAMP domain-containing histidine kinase [Nitrospira sp.]MDH5347597.1 HAMP domain-containing histidine kinase [Nitrospira sp.]MDH5496186.1 HAMP domain-containing histidine kinase [Nitrospira sp.]MDH5725484.1 HAMP domain-containing histidine kinase [Nitrospira sp.]
MFTTLYGKLASVLIGLFCLIGAGAIVLTLYTTRLHFQEVNQKLNRTLAERIVSEKLLMQEGLVNEEAIKDIFHILMVINPSIEVYLLDDQGRILTFSAPPSKVKRQSITLDPLKQFLSGAEDLPILGDDPRDLSRKKIFSAFPIESLSGSIQGYLYVILGGEEFDSVSQMLEGSYILRLSLWAVLATMLFALVTGLFTLRVLTHRLRALAVTMERFKRSDFLKQSVVTDQSHLQPMRAEPRDEIDELGTIFTQMVDRIHTQVTQLNQTDQLRRELVANVSHDLRTPLTSLQGYLETLSMKEGTLSPQEQRTYLEIATKHGERLSKLIAELFELAKLNSPEMMPHIEPFSLSELVQDVVQELRFMAEKKQVHLQTDIRDGLPFVSADIGLIERVLENLIVNAIRHTPERGVVIVTLSFENEKLVTQVTDTGCGIPPEDLPYIFDRYYRVGNSEQGRAPGAGLGLAISKRILELHGSSIEAHSILNDGTTFTFHLHTVQPSIEIRDSSPKA